MRSGSSTAVLHRFFAGLTEQTFGVQLGVADPPLIDYISELLVRFVRTDQMPRASTPSNHLLGEIGRLLIEAESRIGGARRRLHRQVGDVTLFWAGLFPEYLGQARCKPALDWFGEYCTQGKQSYLIASSIETDEPDAPPCEVLERLGRDFEMCAYGLREVRRGWEERNDPAPLMY
ncbi:MAG: hypothetical protein ACYC4U_14425 [Pirellulaceae bacterium]